MTPEQIKRMAQGVVNALNDERSMTPTQYTVALADLRSVMLGLMTGQLVIEQGEAPKPPQLRSNGPAVDESTETH